MTGILRGAATRTKSLGSAVSLTLVGNRGVWAGRAINS